jgi:hypothetical protein
MLMNDTFLLSKMLMSDTFLLSKMLIEQPGWIELDGAIQVTCGR